MRVACAQLLHSECVFLNFSFLHLLQSVFSFLHFLHIAEFFFAIFGFSHFLHFSSDGLFLGFFLFSALGFFFLAAGLILVTGVLALA